ncbi:hypothetical protein GQ457_07G000180 [Hibiscus cannabinus]
MDLSVGSRRPKARLRRSVAGRPSHLFPKSGGSNFDHVTRVDSVGSIGHSANLTAITYWSMKVGLEGGMKEIDLSALYDLEGGLLLSPVGARAAPCLSQTGERMRGVGLLKERSSPRPGGSFLPYSIIFPQGNVLKKKRKIVPGEGESLESRLAKLGLHCKIFLDGK